MIQHEQPADTSNWLPVPAAPFRPILRLYQPQAALLDGTYKIPRDLPGRGQMATLIPFAQAPGSWERSLRPGSARRSHDGPLRGPDLTGREGLNSEGSAVRPRP